LKAQKPSISEVFWQFDLDRTTAEVTDYKTGSRVAYPPKSPPCGALGCADRASRNQSTKSRLNAAFQLGNAETDWLAMATLTYRSSPESYVETRAHRVRLLDRLRKKWKDPHFGWILEFTQNGAPHYHLFLGSGGELGEAIRAEPTLTRQRKGKPVLVFCGDFAQWVAEAWVAIVGDTTDEFRAFQFGGIVEPMRSADAAGRYAAKEAAKRIQKRAPWPVLQWFAISRSVRPKPIRIRRKSLADLIADGLESPISRVFDKKRLAAEPSKVAEETAAGASKKGRKYVLRSA